MSSSINYEKSEVLKVGREGKNEGFCYLLIEVRGLRREERRMIVKDFIRRNKVHVTMLQESKLRAMTDKIAKELWGIRSVR